MGVFGPMLSMKWAFGLLSGVAGMRFCERAVCALVLVSGVQA